MIKRSYSERDSNFIIRELKKLPKRAFLMDSYGYNYDCCTSRTMVWSQARGGFTLGQVFTNLYSIDL